jgi:hypothetical protein
LGIAQSRLVSQLRLEFDERMRMRTEELKTHYEEIIAGSTLRIEKHSKENEAQRVLIGELKVEKIREREELIEQLRKAKEKELW